MGDLGAVEKACEQSSGVQAGGETALGVPAQSARWRELLYLVSLPRCQRELDFPQWSDWGQGS